MLTSCSKVPEDNVEEEQTIETSEETVSSILLTEHSKILQETGTNSTEQYSCSSQ